MTASVLSLLPNRALALDASELAARLRDFADSIETGEIPGIERVCVVFESELAVDFRCYGQPTTRMQIVGLLEYAKDRCINRPSGE